MRIEVRSGFASVAEDIPAINMNIKNTISVKEYAKLKGISEWYVAKLCRLGKIKAVKLGRTWFIKQ